MIRRCLTIILLCSGATTGDIANLHAQWEEVASSHPWRLLDIASASKGHLAASVVADLRFRAAWSIDEGKTWTLGETAPVNGHTYVKHAEIHYFTPRLGVAVMYDIFDQMELGMDYAGCWGRTSDSGRTWRGTSVPEYGWWDEIGWPQKLQYGSGDLVFLPHNRGVLYSSDGESWSEKVFYSGLSYYGGSRIAMTDLDDVSIAGGHTFTSHNSGITFIKSKNYLRNTDSILHFYSIGRFPGGTRVASNGDFLYRSDDDSDQWDPVIRVAGTLQFTYRFGVMYAQGREGLYEGGDKYDQVLLESRDDGLTWTETRFDAEVRSVMPVSKALTYLLVGNKIYKRELQAKVATSIGEGRRIILNNPATDYLLLNTYAKFGRVIVYDVTGRKVLDADASERINIVELPLGVYQLTLHAEGGICSERFVVER